MLYNPATALLVPARRTRQRGSRGWLSHLPVMLAGMNEHDVAIGRWEPCGAFAGEPGDRCAECGWLDDEHRADAYDALYAHYSKLHDHFGRGGDDVMHRLRELRPRELVRD